MSATYKMKRKSFPVLILLITGISFLPACTLDEPAPGNVNQQLTLQATQNLSLTSLSWTPVKVTGFKEYILLQSSEEIPSSPSPEVSTNVSVLKRIDDADVTSFMASDVLFAPRICYKLYASVDDRFIQSGNICVDQDFEILNGFFDRAGHLDGMDEMVLFDRVDKNLISYNYKTGTITNTVTDIVLNFPVIDISNWGGTTNVFAYDQSPARLRKYRYPELTSNMNKDFSAVLFAVNTYNQFIFAAVEDFSKSFQVLNRTNLIETDTKQGLLGNRNIAVFPGDPLIVLEINDNSINRYVVDANGKATLLNNRTPGVSQLNTQSATARGENLFIAGRRGSILNRDGDIMGHLNSSINSFVVIARLSPDETKTAYIISDNNNFDLEVADISNPVHITPLVSYDIPIANYADVVIDDGVIYIVGLSFSSGQAETFVLKYPMP